MTKTQIATEMAKSIGKDLGMAIAGTGYIVGGGLSRLIAMPVVGNFSESIKDNIYGYDSCLDHPRRISRFATGTSIVGNVALAYANLTLTGNDTLDKVLLGYTVIDGICRTGILMATEFNQFDKKEPESPGSLIGGMIGYPLLGLKNYLANEYHEAQKRVAGSK